MNQDSEPVFRRRVATVSRVVLVGVGVMAVLSAAAGAQEAARAGGIGGRVVDAATRQPLPGASVAVVEQGLTAVAGVAGRFTVDDVPPGLHRLQVAVPGYESAIVHDIAVRPGRVVSVTVRLDEARPTVREFVGVTPDYFPRRRNGRSAR